MHLYGINHLFGPYVRRGIAGLPRKLCIMWNHCAAERVTICRGGMESRREGIERVADDTGNRDTCANCLADLSDDKQRAVRRGRHSRADVASAERIRRLLDFGSCRGEHHFGSADRVVDRPSNARPLLAAADVRGSCFVYEFGNRPALMRCRGFGLLVRRSKANRHPSPQAQARFGGE
jgi:hypothetical protein